MYTTRKKSNKKKIYSKKLRLKGGSGRGARSGGSGSVRRRNRAGHTPRGQNNNNVFRPYNKSSNSIKQRKPKDFIKDLKKQNEHHIEKAKEELREGEKKSHWIWYIFPQPLNVFEKINTDPSKETKKYSFNSKEEAFAFIEDEDLVKKYEECLTILLKAMKLSQN